MKVCLELDRCIPPTPQDWLTSPFPPWNNIRDFFPEREGFHTERRKKEEGEGEEEDKVKINLVNVEDTRPQPSSCTWLKM